MGFTNGSTGHSEKGNAIYVAVHSLMILLLVGGSIMTSSVAYADRFDSLIQHYAFRYQVPWTILKAQMITESSAFSGAKSPVGAQGLMQFMPDTWEEWKGHEKASPYNPEDAIDAGVRYLLHLYKSYSEILDYNERWKFALAAYNAGRGNINQVLELARSSCGVPAKYSDWKEAGKPGGLWQKWEYTETFLSHVTGKHSKETRGYVDRIIDLSRRLGYPWL